MREELTIISWEWKGWCYSSALFTYIYLFVSHLLEPPSLIICAFTRGNVFEYSDKGLLCPYHFKVCLYKLYFWFHRGLAVGIYATNSPQACHYVAENCEANVIVVENKHQLHKILQVCKLLCNWFTFKMMDIHAGSWWFYGMLSYTVTYMILYIYLFSPKRCASFT